MKHIRATVLVLSLVVLFSWQSFKVIDSSKVLPFAFAQSGVDIRNVRFSRAGIGLNPDLDRSPARDQEHVYLFADIVLDSVSPGVEPCRVGINAFHFGENKLGPNFFPQEAVAGTTVTVEVGFVCLFGSHASITGLEISVFGHPDCDRYPVK